MSRRLEWRDLGRFDLDPIETLHAFQAVHKAMGDLLEQVRWPLLRKCDCGHAFIEHRPVTRRDGIPEGWLNPCGCDGCGCVDFDDSARRAAEWRRDNPEEEQ